MSIYGLAMAASVRRGDDGAVAALAAVDGGDGVIERGQRIVVEVEMPVAVDFDLARTQDADARCRSDNLLGLLAQPRGVEAVGDAQRVRMVADAVILIAALPRRRRHFGDGRAAVAPDGVRVQVATDVIERHQPGQARRR